MRRIFLGILISAMAALLVAAPAMAGEVGTENTLSEEISVFSEVEDETEETDSAGEEVEEYSSEEDVLAEDLAAACEDEDSDAQDEDDELGGAAEEEAIATYSTAADTGGGEKVGGDADVDDDADTVEEADDEAVSGDEDDDYGIALLDVKQDSEEAVTNGFGQDPTTGDWYYYTDGQIDTSKNSVVRDTDKRISGTDDWWYVVGGKVQMNFTGLANYSNSSGWWYITNGKVDRTYNGLAKNNNGWFYLTNGKVDRSYTGFATNENGSWYMESGKLTRKTNSVVKDAKGAIGPKNEWYYVVGSKVQYDFTGLANYSNASGWWYITDGKVDRTVTTVAKNKNGWYYVKNGKVDRSYTGFATNANGSWYMESGKLTRNTNSVIKDTKGAIGAKNEWYYVVGSKVRYDFTGLANYRNASGWWYITDGKVDRTVNTVAKNKNGWYYVENGKVNQSYTGIAENSNGWWYIKSGRVDFSAGDYSFAANTSQIIDVQASGSTGTLTLYNKNGNHFDKVLSTSCYVGRNGITSNKSEGDGKTPSGVYTLGQAFGVASDPGSTRSYLKVNSNYYWVDDSTSRYYNQLVDVSKVSKDWSSAEHLIDYTSAYKYAIAVDYNTDHTPYKGSAIFLHCSTGGSTSGCVAVSESYMVQILQSLKSDTRIYIH